MGKGALVFLVAAAIAGSRLTTGAASAPDDQTANQSILITPSEANASAVEAEDTSIHQASLGGTLALPRRSDGHFTAEADVNGSSITFIVDTGATLVSLSRADAERAGVTVDPDRFVVVGKGASGPVRGLPLVLHSLDIGGHRFTDVPAVVLADGGESLLGQNVLRQFANVSIEDDQMLLR